MHSPTTLTVRQKFENMKKQARSISYEDKIESGKYAFQRRGVDPEDVDRMARLVDLEANDLFYLASGAVTVVPSIQSTSPRDAISKSKTEVEERLIRLEEVVSRLGRIDTRLMQSVDERIVTHLRRIADHFDPPNLESVGTSYIAQRLGVTPKWVGDLVRKGDIPSSCICPKSGNGNYWRFWKNRIDKWIEER